jgi:Rieske Fe-S protein
MAMTSSRQRSDRKPLYGLGALGLASVALAAPVILLVSFLSPSLPDSAVAPVAAGRLSDLEPRQPVFYENGDFWLVRLDRDEVAAFVARDTHGRAADIGCTSGELALGHRLTSHFEKGVVLWDTTGSWNGQNTFRAFCSASRFDYAGNRLYGPSPRGLDRYPVEVDESGFITVSPRLDQVIRGPATAR